MEAKKEIERLQEVDKVRPSSYTLGKINKKKALMKERAEDAIRIILEATEYYNKEYPNSTRGVEWSNVKIPIRLEEIDDIDDFLAKCSEEELYNIREILVYTQKELVRTIKDRDRYDLVIVRVKKRIPGIKYVERLEGVREKENQIIKERKGYERLILEAREQFEFERLEAIKPIESTEPIDVIESVEKLEPYFCSMCAREHIKGKIYHDHLEFKVS